MPYFRINPKTIYSIAKKEFIDNVKSKWIIALTAIFIILTLATSYLAGGGSSSTLGGMEQTAIMLISITSILIPIIAIMLGYATISGECESGSLAIVLSYPVRRSEVLIGKILGLGFVIVISAILGFGLSGAVIAATAGAESWVAYLGFIGHTIIIGVLYLSVSLCLSTIAKRRVTSLAGGVVLFFWGMIYGTIVFGAYIAAGGDISELMSGTVAFPDWLWASVVFSPMDMSQMAVMFTFGISSVFGFNMETPSFMNLGTLLIAQAVWIIIPLILAFYFFHKRDI